MKLKDGLHQSQPLADEENLSAFEALVLEALGQERLSKLSKKQSGALMSCKINFSIAGC